MLTSNSLRWLVVVAGAAMLLAVAAACGAETVEVPGETVVVEKVVTETVEVPGETVVVEKEVIKTVEVPGETVTKEVVKEVMVPGETVVVKEEVVKTVEVPGQTVVKEVVKTVEVPGQTVVVEKEVVKTVEVPGETVVVEKEVVKTVEVPGQTVVVEKVVVQEVPGKKYVTDPATGMTWTAPQYGGTLTWAAAHYSPSTDNWWNTGWAQHLTGGVNESLAFADWGLSRDIWDGRVYPVVYPEMTRGSLAESWSMPDDTTFIFNIRKGVYWDDKAPVNGREFDAYDVEWNYHRYLGLGDFTEDGPNAAVGAITQGADIESVTATDKWTVEIKLTKPDVLVMRHMLNNYFFVHAPEQIEKYGDAKDWRNLVGTGPWRLTEYVEGSSATWEKNPNYWGYDEKFPLNRLPYIDELRSLLMPDTSTRLAAMRTGKIDMLSQVGDAYINSIDDLEALQRTNPEIDVWPTYGTSGFLFYFNQSLPLMQDVIVRKALQMAVDRETILATFFKGQADPAPYGIVKQSQVGWAWPYEDWPDDVKHEYEYHPEEAEALLDSIGLTRGADGIRFKVKLAYLGSLIPEYAEIVAGYLEAIGVDSKLVPLELAESNAAQRAETLEWELFATAYGFYGGTLAYTIGFVVPAKLSGFVWPSKLNDPRLVALYLAAKEATDIEELKSIYRQADEITIREHVAIVKSTMPQFAVSQPWVQGYFGEAGMGWGERMTHLARIWIDSELKEALGR